MLMDFLKFAPDNALYVSVGVVLTIIPILVSLWISSFVFLRKIKRPIIILTGAIIVSTFWTIQNLHIIQACYPKELCPNYSYLIKPLSYLIFTSGYFFWLKRKKILGIQM